MSELIPSQAIESKNQTNNNKTKRRRNRNNNKKHQNKEGEEGKQQHKQQQQQQRDKGGVEAKEEQGEKIQGQGQEKQEQGNGKGKGKKGRRKTNTNTTTTTTTTTNNNSNNNNNNTNGENKKKQKKPKQRNKKKKHTWRKYIKHGTVDPISLEPLIKLPYPPFALAITKPYTLINWPPQLESQQSKSKSASEASKSASKLQLKTTGKGDVDDSRDDEIRRQAKILEEQWGSNLTTKHNNNNGSDINNGNGNDNDETTTTANATSTTNDNNNNNKTDKEDHVHLFDGRVLANYLVSQLQFIDPLNRRDLTRNEIIHLDTYLKRHNLKQATSSVIEAYDNKGVTLNSAGISGQTPRGRAEILQQQAQVFLNSLFQHPTPNSNNGTTTTTNGTGTGNGNANANANGNTNRRRGRGRRNGNNRERENEDDYNNNNNNNQFARQYAAFEPTSGRNNNDDHTHNHNHNHTHNHTQQQYHYNNHHNHHNDDGQLWYPEGGANGGVYEQEGGGLLIIDDNANPDLRGVTDVSDVYQQQQYYQPTSSDPFPTLSWHGHRVGTTIGADNFPALSATTTTAANASISEQGQEGPSSKESSTTKKNNNNNNNKNKKGVSKSLLKIGKLIQKTDPKVIEKQKKAREEALRKMELARMPYEEYVKRQMNDTLLQEQQTLDGDTEQGQRSVPPSNGGMIIPTEKQLERNKNLADALGVKPSTIRKTANSFYEGWKRPTSTKVSMDEFGNELNVIEYADELIIEARERMPELLKLEKKWVDWLNDDKAASCSLKKMDKPTRIFVHKYSDFWNIETRSYDPEPKRYIHCVKMLETFAPYPLLSTAVRKWRGPIGTTFLRKTPAPEISQQQSEEITSSSVLREFPLTDDRVPLKLALRSLPKDYISPPLLDDPSSSHIPESDVQVFGSQEPTERFAPLMAERERNKLTLDPRTKPLELPPCQPSKKKIEEEMKKSLNKMRLAEEMKKNQAAERKKRVLLDAFASDDEEESHSDSEWEVEEALYSISDEEE